MTIEEHCLCGIPSRYDHECRRADIPIPHDLVAAKNAGRRERKQSAWPVFFEKWQIGESVVVSWTALASIQTYAKRFDHEIFWQREGRLMDGMASARVWRIA